MIRSVLWLLMLWLPATITTYQDWLVVNSPYKGPVTRKMFPFDDVIMFRRRSQKTSKFRVTGLYAGNSPVPGANALELLFLAPTHRYMIGTWRDNAKSEHAAEDQFEIRSRRISCHLHLSRRFQFRPDQWHSRCVSGLQRMTEAWCDVEFKSWHQWLHIQFNLFQIEFIALPSHQQIERIYIYIYIYRQVSNIRRTFVGNKIADHSDVVGASPVSAAPTTSSFST